MLDLVERPRSHVLVAVTPRLLGDSLTLALDRAGDWDVVHLDDLERLDPLDRATLAAIVTSDHRGDLVAEIVIELPDPDKPSRYGYVEIGGQRHRADVGTIDAIVDLLREEQISPRRAPDANRLDGPSRQRPAVS